ncbi:uncharacterized protein Z519_01556 [Cladophialophora bantiana CBS 173.52]|uniref:Uncharacterized protein n=1 Tax=Cladophialophora bantiana (strain ATCC 10958 / CBS 173.52 / CDC B-1940 / NIH 8579) TaxID=1442370 RepID=A0A0D2GI03_CLAB1|nr:uncharacterized protein Z519_01556 [Cladophialophora bantiana CBS 173.52]KIW97972.1 hypothetical protein Z519_01556 [Cladophialophora bantiana CBS 173.52]
MRILIAVTAQDDFLRTIVSVMNSDDVAEDCQLLHGPQHRQPTSKAEPIEVVAKPAMVAELSAAQSDGAPSTGSYSFRQFLRPKAIHIALKLFSAIGFCALLFPYLRYSGSKKAAVHEICKQNARSLYESRLALCDAGAATEFNFYGALGLHRLEFGTMLLVAVAWQHVMWLFEVWVMMRIRLVKNDCQE